MDVYDKEAISTIIWSIAFVAVGFMLGVVSTLSLITN
jgi:hypothetical protein